MKLVKTASGKQTIKMSKPEWQSIGKKAGWMKKAMWDDAGDRAAEDDEAYSMVLEKAKEAVAAMTLAVQNDSLQGKEDAFLMLKEAVSFAPSSVAKYYDKKDKEAKLNYEKEDFNSAQY